jgi:hypothetical protein
VVIGNGDAAVLKLAHAGEVIVGAVAEVFFAEETRRCRAAEVAALGRAGIDRRQSRDRFHRFLELGGGRGGAATASVGRGEARTAV